MQGESLPASRIRVSSRSLLEVAMRSEGVVRVEAMACRDAVRHGGGIGSLMRRDGRVGKSVGEGL